MQNHVLQWTSTYATNVANKIISPNVPYKSSNSTTQSQATTKTKNKYYQVTSEPTDPDSSSDDEYLQRICPEYR